MPTHAIWAHNRMHCGEMSHGFALRVGTIGLRSRPGLSAARKSSAPSVFKTASGPARRAATGGFRSPSCPGCGVVRVGIDDDLRAQLPGQAQVAVVQVQPLRSGVVLDGHTQFRRPAQHHAQVQANGSRRSSRRPWMARMRTLGSRWPAAPARSSLPCSAQSGCGRWR